RLPCTTLFRSAVTGGGSSLLISADRQQSVLAVVAGCGALKLALGALLVFWLGLAGAAIAYVAVAIASATAMMALAIRVSGVVPDWGRLLRAVAAAGLAAVIVLPLRGQLLPRSEERRVGKGSGCRGDVRGCEKSRDG